MPNALAAALPPTPTRADPGRAGGPAHEWERLVRENMGLARSLASRYRSRGESLDDLTQVAYLGLVQAARRYRPGEGHPFLAFAVPTITGELRKHFRDHGWAVRPPRRLQDLRSRIRFTEEDLRQELQREPTVSELAARLDVAPDELGEALRAAESYHALSLDAPASGQDPASGSQQQTLGDVLQVRDGDDGLDGLVDAASIRPLLDELGEREQLVLALRFYGGLTQRQIAERIGVTQMQVSRLLTQILARLRSQALAGTAS